LKLGAIRIMGTTFEQALSKGAGKLGSAVTTPLDQNHHAINLRFDDSQQPQFLVLLPRSIAQRDNRNSQASTYHFRDDINRIELHDVFCRHSSALKKMIDQAASPRIACIPDKWMLRKNIFG